MRLPISGQNAAWITGLLAAVMLLGGSARSEAAPPEDDLAARIGASLGDRALRGASVGIMFVLLPGGEPIYALNAGLGFSPASTVKLLTTAAALCALSPDYQFETSLLARGNLDGDGTLHGDIVVRGGGDPSISGRFHGGDELAVLKKLAAAVRTAGIAAVRGDVVGDDGFFDSEYIPAGWPRNQLDAYYCAPVCALSLNENCIDVVVSGRNAPGAACDVSLIPANSHVKVVNRTSVSSKSKRAGVAVTKAPGKDVIYVSGACPKGKTLRQRVTVADPAMYFVTVYRDLLEKAGVSVTGTARVEHGTDSGGGKLLYRWRSGLVDAIIIANKKSHNFYAEQILKTLGRETTGSGSFSGGIQAIRNLMEKICPLDDTFQLYDGSGLTRKNRAAPRQMTALLVHMYSHPHATVFLNSLARAGEDGTLSKRLRAAPYRGRILAKTGYVWRQAAFAGYILTEARNGAFCIFVGDFDDEKLSLAEVHRVQDQIVAAMYDYLLIGN